ncbi:small integral membrane protein 24 [Crocuta crocuta]
MGTLGTLFLLGALLLSPAEAQEAFFRFPISLPAPHSPGAPCCPPSSLPVARGHQLMGGRLGPRVSLLPARHPLTPRFHLAYRDGDEESKLRMETNPHQDVSEEGKRKKKERVKGDEAEEEEGERNAGLELDEKEGPRDEEQLRNTAM